MKNKIKLIVFLIPLVLLSTGCSATYNLTITEDSIKEELAISENMEKATENSYIYKYGSYDEHQICFDCLRNYISDMQNEYVNKYYINKDNFERDNKIQSYNNYKETYSYYLTNEKEYSLKSNSLINNIFRDSLIINDENIIIHLDNISSNLLEKLDNIDIKITTDLPVVSNNADSVDENTYTWNYDKTNNLTKSISLYIERPKIEEDNKTNNKQNNSNTKKGSSAFSLIIMIVIYLVIIIFVINFFNKKKKLF